MNENDIKMNDSDEVFDWLRWNLGGKSLAALTGTDEIALAAAVAVLRLLSCSYIDGGCDELLNAFASCVRKMQPSTQYLAYHAIAHVMDWPDRREIWRLAGLPAIENPGRCKFE